MCSIPSSCQWHGRLTTGKHICWPDAFLCCFSPRPLTECLACAGQSVSLVFIQFITYLKLSRLRADSLHIEQLAVEMDVMH